MVKAISTLGVLVVKMKDVAELAGVSSAAVSRYLNRGYISADKAERIKQAIELTGYVRSNQARALRTGSTKLIGVIVPKMSSESIGRSVDGTSSVLTPRGYQMLLAGTDSRSEREPGLIELFEGHPVDGIILLATHVSARHRAVFKSCKVPLVVIGQCVPGTSCVFNDEFGAARELAARLAASGSRHPSYIGVSRRDVAVGTNRADGFRAGMEGAGISLSDSLCRESDFSLESGYEAARSLLGEQLPIDTIACATDTIAAGAIRAVRDSGRRAPGGGEIRVSGFGDSRMVRMLSGGIPTVHFGLKTAGVRAAELLLDMIGGRESLPVQISLGFEVLGV